MPHGNNQASMAIQLEQGKAAAWLQGCLSYSETPKGFRAQAPAGGAALLGCVHLPFPREMRQELLTWQEDLSREHHWEEDGDDPHLL